MLLSDSLSFLKRHSIDKEYRKRSSNILEEEKPLENVRHSETQERVADSRHKYSNIVAFKDPRSIY